MNRLASLGQMPANPLKTTTAEIYHGWQEELSQLQRRWNEIQTNAQEERGEVSEEAEGLRLRLQALRDLLAEAVVVGGAPESWRTEVPVVKLGSVVRVAFEDGMEEDLLFLGLAGPMDDKVLTPKTPLGAAILGRKVGERVPYHVGDVQYHAIIRRCLVPDDRKTEKKRVVAAAGGVKLITGEDEREEAAMVAAAIRDLIAAGASPQEIALSWRAPYQSGPFEERLLAEGIPFRIEGADGFYDLFPVQGILAMLRLVLEETNGAAFLTAARTFTNAPLEALEKTAAEWRGPGTELPRPVLRARGMAGFLAALKETPTDRPPQGILQDLRQRLGRSRPDWPREGPLSPWTALIGAAREFADPRKFLAHARDVAGRSKRGAREGVLLTPLPMLGDRRFKLLFLVGANEGALPLLDRAEDALPAERELFYDVLAAAESAAISWARTIGGKPARKSRFLVEIAGKKGK